MTVAPTFRSKNASGAVALPPPPTRHALCYSDCACSAFAVAPRVGDLQQTEANTPARQRDGESITGPATNNVSRLAKPRSILVIIVLVQTFRVNAPPPTSRGARERRFGCEFSYLGRNSRLLRGFLAGMMTSAFAAHFVGESSCPTVVSA